MNDDIRYSAKGRRDISEFVGRELLYDYVTLQLDMERLSALDELVKRTPEMKAEIQKIKDGLKYFDQLSETLVADSIVDKIKTPSTYFQVLLQKLKIEDWPMGARLGIEITIVATLIISTALLIPWHKLANLELMDIQAVVLTEVHKAPSPGSKTETEIARNENNEGADKPLYQDETSSTAAPSTTTTVVVASGGAAAKVVATSATATTLAPSSAQGSLHRGTIDVSNLTATTSKFVEKITELGGRKAGEVPLGWKKGSGTYFHFTIPEKQLELLKGFMNEYGTLKLERERHPRVMPEGIVRIIITVEESKKPK